MTDPPGFEKERKPIVRTFHCLNPHRLRLLLDWASIQNGPVDTHTSMLAHNSLYIVVRLLFPFSCCVYTFKFHRNARNSLPQQVIVISNNVAPVVFPFLLLLLHTTIRRMLTASDWLIIWSIYYCTYNNGIQIATGHCLYFTYNNTRAESRTLIKEYHLGETVIPD